MDNIPIRVLCVFGRLDRGGAETMCMNLYRNIDRSRIQFDFVKHTQDHCSFDDEIEQLGGRIFLAPRLSFRTVRAYLRWWNTHLKAHREHRIIHGHLFTIASVYFFIGHKHGCVTIGHSHSSEPPKSNSSIKKTIKRFLRIFTEYESDYCLACSETAGKWLFPHKRFVVLKNAIDARAFSFDEEARKQMRRELGFFETDSIVCAVGSMTEPKNPLGTVSLFFRFLKTNPNAKLLWCGEGELRQEVESLVYSLKISDSVVFAGIRSDISRILQAADVYIMPSFYEGLPLAAIEAQAAGLPCVLSDAISREAAITDQCEFVPLDDPDAWVQAIERGLARGRSDATQQIIDAGYDIHTTAEWLQDFYLKLEQDYLERQTAK